MGWNVDGIPTHSRCISFTSIAENDKNRKGKIYNLPPAESIIANAIRIFAVGVGFKPTRGQVPLRLSVCEKPDTKEKPLSPEEEERSF
jgi:hypothetical protein